MAVLATAALTVATAAALVPTMSEAAGVTTHSVSKTHGEYLTSYQFANGDSAKILDLRSGRVASQASKATRNAASADAAGSTIYEGGVDLAASPSLTAENKVAALSTPIADTSDAAMVQALGAPASIVAEFAAQDTLDGTATDTAAPTKMTTTASYRPAATTAAAVTGKLYNRTCLGGHFDNNQGGYYGCFNQYITHDYGNGNWYMADHFYSSAFMHDTAIFNPDELTGLAQGVGYGSNNNIYDWQPKNTVNGGNCSQQTVTVGGFGQSYSTTYTRCPEVYGLHYISHWTFHTKWDGQGDGPNNGSRDTSGVDLLHDPANASPAENLYLHYWYD